MFTRYVTSLCVAQGSRFGAQMSSLKEVCFNHFAKNRSGSETGTTSTYCTQYVHVCVHVCESGVPHHLNTQVSSSTIWWRNSCTHLVFNWCKSIDVFINVCACVCVCVWVSAIISVCTYCAQRVFWAYWNRHTHTCISNYQVCLRT